MLSDRTKKIEIYRRPDGRQGTYDSERWFDNIAPDQRGVME
jgi:hypothetical protein